MPDVYECVVDDVSELAEFTYSITVKGDKPAKEARAGQFLHIKCGEGSLLRRPVSISRVRGSTLEFVFEVKGEGTRWLSKRSRGETLDVLGPLGNGFHIPDGKFLLIGGGVGAAPLLFAAESAKGQAAAVLGFRDASRIVLRSEFERVCEEVVVTTDDGSYGTSGFVTDPLEVFLKRGGYSAALACGPYAMLRNVAKLCELYGVPCMASLEERMGCGIGACLVCACAVSDNGQEQMRRVCRDGPVFDAKEIVWK